MSRYIGELLGFRGLISRAGIFVQHLVYGGVFILCWHYNILCWHYKGNKLRSIYRNTKSQDYFIASNATRWLAQEAQLVYPQKHKQIVTT